MIGALSENAEFDIHTNEDSPCTGSRARLAGSLVVSRDYLIASSVVVGFAMVALGIYFGLAHRETASARSSEITVNALNATKPTAATAASAAGSSR
ncbi:hypothetical protein [Labilithrix luteola]|nr:hypothetical protein [Labilithrix luteola]